MIKRLFYIIIVCTALVLLAYWLQPIKKGHGTENAISYVLDKDWLNLPKTMNLGNPTGIGIDTAGNIILFHRAGRSWPLVGAMPVQPIKDKTILVIDRNNGALLNSWGDHLFVMPHGLTVDQQNNIWVTDVGLHQVFKFSHDGKLLMALGEAGKAGKDAFHFNKPTDVAVANDGSFYVSDGYGNSRVVKFSAEGKYLFEWGTKGDNEGQFNIPHAICLDASENVYVADRENDRIQVFDKNGKFLKQYSDKSFGEICSVSFNSAKTKLFAVDDFSFLRLKHRGSDVLVFDTLGHVLTRFGRSGDYSGHTCWYHDLVVDKDENIYVTDILGNTVQKFRKVVP